MSLASKEVCKSVVWLGNFVPLGLGEIKSILGFSYPFLQKEVREGPW